MKLFRFLLVAIIAVLLWGTTEISADAKQKVNERPTEGVAAKSDLGESSIDIRFSIQAYRYMEAGYNYLRLAQYGQADIGGETHAKQQVDSIGVDVYLQKWNSDQKRWVDLFKADSASAINSRTVETSKKVSLIKGSLYRTKTYHWIVDGSSSESTTAYSSYLTAK
ncbi:DUF6147 family protein [Bacillus suaedae]|uniref:Uncharacterized protein n=1 Tax=Halalkalibacter suaedae TaxID=2822140 RepID=A0A940WYG2_9BACI|nr:DUF6147 family protein [Bacillus suaedae]MBP3953117.1 hypothetical protein [Bacillus suaedae]